MTPINKTDPELDSLVDELTADCHDEDEQLMGFANAFDEVNFPLPRHHHRRRCRSALRQPRR